jgi:hypothetical protein
MSEENKRIVEIDGVKLEVDLRTAKKIDHYKIGDPVRVLVPDSSYERVKAGVIVGFCEFEKNPQIEILVLSEEYNGVNFKIVTYPSSGNKPIEICPFDRYQGLFSQTDIVTRFDREIQKKELELADLKLKKEYFINDFAKAFDRVVPGVSLV